MIRKLPNNDGNPGEYSPTSPHSKIHRPSWSRTSSRVRHPSDDDISQDGPSFSRAAVSSASHGPRNPETIGAASDPVPGLSRSASAILSNPGIQENEWGFGEIYSNIETLQKYNEMQKGILATTKKQINHQEQNTNQLREENGILKRKVGRLKGALNKTFLGKWFDKHHRSGMTLAVGGATLSAGVGSVAATVAGITIAGLVTGTTAVAAWPVTVAVASVGAVVLAGIGIAWCVIKIRDYCKIAQAEKNPSLGNGGEDYLPA